MVRTPPEEGWTPPEKNIWTPPEKILRTPLLHMTVYLLISSDILGYFDKPWISGYPGIS